MWCSRLCVVYITSLAFIQNYINRLFLCFPMYREQWFSNIRGDVLSGIVVACTHSRGNCFFYYCRCRSQSRAICFILYCSRDLICGWKTRMISAATGAMALLMVTLVKEHGLEYLLAATILTGVIQIVAAS